MNIWLLTLLASFVATGVSAQDTESSPRETEARAEFEIGSTAFREGRFEYALERFKRAHTLTSRPGLLYNIGLTLERLQRPEEAIEALEGYLSATPDSPNRANVEARVTAMRETVAERHALEEELSAARAAQAANQENSALTAGDPQEREPQAKSKWWLWTLIGIVVVGAGVGVAVALTRDSGVQEPLPGDEGVVVSTLTEW